MELFECPSAYVEPTAAQLNKFTREQLRKYAVELGVERGQNKRDTIANLIASGKAKCWVVLSIL